MTDPAKRRASYEDLLAVPARRVGVLVLTLLLPGCEPSPMPSEAREEPDSAVAPAGSASGEDTSSSGGAPVPEPIPPAPVDVFSPGDGSDSLGDRDAEIALCPEGTPEVGSACGDQNRWCTYGDDAIFGCRDTFYCSESGWRSYAAPFLGCEGPCPQESPEDEDPCTENVAGDECQFDGGRSCVCLGLAPNSVWYCYETDLDPECPVVAPNQGTACSIDDLFCPYAAHCFGGALAICRSGVWMLRGSRCDQ